MQKVKRAKSSSYCNAFTIDQRVFSFIGRNVMHELIFK